MSNVIQFLEAMGKDASPSRFSPDEYAAMVASLDVENAQRQALLDRDHAKLNGLLGGRPKMVCALWPADEPQKEHDEPAKEDDGGDPKPDDSDSKAQRSN